MKRIAPLSVLLLAFLFSISSVSLADNTSKSWGIKYTHPKCFIENQGQFQIANSTEKVLFAFDNGGTKAYFTNKGLTYSFLNTWKKDEDEEDDNKYKEKEWKLTSAAIEEYKKKEAEEHKLEYSTDQVSFEWENSNPNVQIIAEDKFDSYFIYTFKNEGKETNIDFIPGYRKITYKNLYPNIDVVYVFHPKEGIKYSIILHPGADPSQVKMKYAESENLSFDNSNNLNIKTKFGKIIDHAPVTFYEDNSSDIVDSKFVKTGNEVSFEIANYDNTKTLVIDPWTVTPAFATNWDCVWECEKDAAGNVYIIGGVTPLQLLKYNSTGVLQWTYNTPYDTSSWLGTFATDNLGNSYVTEGSVAAIIKVSTAGALIWNNPSPGGIFASTEFWNIAFNCDQTELVIAGTGGFLPPLPYIYNVNTGTGNVTASVQVTGGALFPTQEVRSITACGNGKFYYLTHDSIGFIDQNFSFCPTGSASAKYHKTNGYAFGYKCENWRYNNTGICAIRANTNFVYTHKGSAVDKRSLVTANVITSAAIAGGGFTGGQVKNSGIDIDNCGNVYVGSQGSVVKYDANLVLLATYPVAFNVYDVHVTPSGDIIACGTTGNSGTAVRTGYIQQITAGACAPIALTCCDASICAPTTICNSSVPITLQGATAGGTWSGVGVNAVTGVFDPAVSGAGTFPITYTLACGSDVVNITVNVCATLALCQGAGLSCTVSGGTGPYTWQSGVITNPCVAGVGFCGPPFTVAGPAVTTWTTFATGTTVTLPGTYPIHVTDSNGNVITLANAAAYTALANCASCPPLTVNISSQVNVACFGASTGSFNASTTGGASPWDYTLMNGATTVATFTNIPGTQSFTGLPAGTYTLNVLDNNGCPGTTTITITQPAAATTVAAAGPNQTVCGTIATLAGNIATVGTGAWTLVSGAGTITTPASPTSGITGLGVGANVFMWTISNPPCTSTTSTVTITGIAAPTTSVAGPNQTVCGTTATLAGNTPVVGTGLWTLVSGTGTITTPASPSSGLTGLGVGANVFQWTISNAPCPSSSTTVTITGVAAPSVAAAGPAQTVCGTTATLAGNAPAIGTGAWTLVSGAGTITTPTSPTSGITALGVGANVFMWTISNAPCPASTSTVTITGVASPTVANAGPNQTICSTSATLAGNIATIGTGTWTLVSGTGTITTPGSPTSGVTGLGLGANVFQWTITNAPCPPTSSTVTITSTGGATTSNAGTNQTVCGTTATLAGNTPVVGTGAWTLVSGSGTATTPSSPTSGVTGLGVGPNVFMWTITSAPCAPSTSTVTITGVAAPSTSVAGPNQTVCSTSATFAGNVPAIGTGTWTLVSGAGTITTPGSATSTVTGLGAGANVFMWTIDNAPCPPSTSTVTITNTGGPTTSVAGANQTVCGTTATLAGNTPVVGTGAWTLVSGAGTITTPTSPTSGLTGLGVGPNVFMWTISSAPCPPSTSTVTITGVAAPTVANAGPNQSLCNTFSTLAGNTPVVGTGTWTLVSGTGTITTPGSATSGVTGLGLGANVFMWTISNAPCPSSTSTVTITNTGGPTVTVATQTNVNCNSATTGSATVSVSGGIGSLTYSWTAGAGSSSSASGLAAGTYVVTVTDSVGCAGTASVTITQPTAITASVAVTNATCGATDGTATATVNGGTGSYTYNWTPGSPIGDGTNAITNLLPGSYTCTITDSLGCIQSVTGSVGSVGGPAVDAGTDVTIASGGSTVLTGIAGAGATFSWAPPGSLTCDTCASTIASPTVTTIYILTVTQGGCSSSDTVTVFVDVACGEIFVPNVFSPNGDNENDTLKVYGNCITDLEFVIFDRWGEKVFETDDPSKGWDGKVRGKKMDTAVFVYYLNAAVNGILVRKHGNITLVK